MNRRPSKLTWAAVALSLAALSATVLVLRRSHDRPIAAASPDDAAAGPLVGQRPGSPGASTAAAPPAPRFVPAEPRAAQPRDPVAAYEARLNARLEAEPPDPAGSAHSAAEVRERMAQLPVAGVSLLQVDCARTVCSLDFKLAAGTGLGALKKVAIDFPWPTTGFITTAEDDPTRAVMYVAREGHALPPYQ